MLSQIVPPNSQVSCSTMPMRLRNASRRIAVMSTPSIVIRPRIQLVEAQDEVDQRRLARTGRADDGDGVARLGDQRQVLDQRLVRLVAERHVLELDPPAALGRQLRIGRVGSLLRGVEQVEDPLGRRHAGLQQVRHRGDLGQRLGELARVLDERLHVAERQRAGRDPQPADDGDHDVVEVADEHHRRHDHAADELRAPAGRVQLVVGARERLLAVALAPEHPHDLVPGERLLDVRVQPPGGLPLGDEARLRALRDRLGDQHRHRDRDQRDQRQQRRDHEHDDDDADDGEQRGQQLAQRLLQALGDVVDVVRDPAEQLAAGWPST